MFYWVDNSFAVSNQGIQTLRDNKTLALRARVSYRVLVFEYPDETLKLVSHR